MTRITKPMRGRGPNRRLDLSPMRELFRDTRVWTAIGIVEAPEGVESHWEAITDGGDTVDITVEVTLQPSQVPLTCRLRAGLWEVPNAGDEVLVVVPDGEIDFMPVVVARLSGNSVPTVQAPEPGRLVIVNGEVYVHAGAGGAKALAYADDVENLRAYVRAQFAATGGHVHVVAGSATTTQTAVAFPQLAVPTVEPDAVVGTSVLFGK